MPDADRIRWDDRHRAAGVAGAVPSPFLVTVADLLPLPTATDTPTALDVAGGTGRNALWLARRGVDVTLADISPVALDLAAAAAAAAGVHLRPVAVDLEVEALPVGPFDLVVSTDFLHRPLFAGFPVVLAPGGLLLFAHPTRTNLERNPHPSARHLLEDGELPALVRGLDVVRYAEGWFDGRHEARLVARRG